MKQSRSTSLLKSLISTFLGLGLSIFLQWLILPMLLGVPVPLFANLTFAAIMTAVSIARGYALERFFEWMGWRVKLSPFMHAVLFECGRQRDHEGYSTGHDDMLPDGDLAAAGATYLLHAGTQSKTTPHEFPWRDEEWKPRDRRRNLVRGCALGIAEGDKFDRSRKQKRRSF
jgi:hypothetical protein